jgi:hypothetical protein
MTSKKTRKPATKKASGRKADSMVVLAHELNKDLPKEVRAEIPPPTPAVRKTGDVVTGERRIAHSQRDLAGLDFSVPESKRVSAPTASRTFGSAKSCEPLSANRPNARRG